MIYLISDLHGNKDFSGLHEYLKIATDNDLLIILGDLGLNFAERPDFREFTDFFLSIDKNIAFVDGNHENFEYLKSFPEEDYHGGRVHRITPRIVHLMRGQVFDFEDKRFFVFGGCKSSDIWKSMGLWNPRESGSDEEYATAYDSLKKHGCSVDYVLTHRYYNEDARKKGNEKIIELIEYIDNNVDFKKWYAGHFHFEKSYDEKHRIVYDKLVTLGD